MQEEKLRLEEQAVLKYKKSRAYELWEKELKEKYKEEVFKEERFRSLIKKKY